MARLRRAYEAVPPEHRDIAMLDVLIDQYTKDARAKRLSHQVVLDMIRGLIPTTVEKTGQPEEWVTRVLEFTVHPIEREARDAIDLNIALEELAADVDPDNRKAGDIIGPGDDLGAWFKRILAE